MAGGLLGLAMVCGGEAAAGGVRNKARAQVVMAGSSVIVPFAVPVAVPVARVLVPNVWYGYRVTMPERVPEGEVLRQDVEGLTAERVLEGHCSTCHGGWEAKGGLSIFDEAGGVRAKLPRRKMLEAVEAGTMPRGGERLSEEEVELLREWAKPPRELEW